MIPKDRMPGATFAPENTGFLDFETASDRTDIRDGTYAYAIDAHAIVLAYAIGEAKPRSIAMTEPGQALDFHDPRLAEVRAHHARVLAGEAIWAAWNAGFDRAIWNYALRGSPEMAPQHMIDVMAQGSAAGLDPDLARAGKQAGGSIKLDTGKDLIRLFCVPGAPGNMYSHPQEWEQFLLYARTDVAVLRDVFRHTQQLPIAEWREYWAMEDINQRGALIDCDLAGHAAAMAKEDRSRSAVELGQITQGYVTSVDMVLRMVDWLLRQLPPEGVAILLKRESEHDEEGFEITPAKYQLTRNRVQRLLTFVEAKLPLRRDVLRLLQIRLYGGSKMPAKFGRAMAAAYDGVLRGQYVFNGAGQTGRASSRGVQIHNLSRDALPYEYEAIEAVRSGRGYDHLAALGDTVPVARKLSLLLRPLFMPAPGKVFVWSDWSQIEARVLPWLAGNDDPGAKARLDIFCEVDADHSKPDLYTRTAAELSHCAIEDVTKPLRQRGKVAELALGFGGGVGALQNMAAGYGLFLDDGEARDIVHKWREANPWCVRFWGGHGYEFNDKNELEQVSFGLWGAAQRAIQQPGVAHRAGRIHYVYRAEYFGGSLQAVLPSGRCLTYRHCKFEPVQEKDEATGRIIRVENLLRFSRGSARVKLWHGMLTENVVQAVAADCLRGTLLRLTETYPELPVVLHTHDEVVIEVPERRALWARNVLRSVMRQGFIWSGGLPLMSDETVAYYYTKQETAYETEAGIERLSRAHRDVSL